WGGGGAGGWDIAMTGGGGGAYSRTVLDVTPGVIYTVQVGGGGQALNPFAHVSSAQPGSQSSFSNDTQQLIFAGGGSHGDGFQSVPGGLSDSSAAISNSGGEGTLTGGGLAFGAMFCPNGGQTGRGGDLFQSGQPGYVVLVW